MNDSTIWCLEGLDQRSRLVRVPLHDFPFRIGRLPGLELTLVSERVSKLQAQIDEVGDRLKVRDLGSRNGTFVDRQRIERDVELEEGAILHFADQEFEVVAFRGESMKLMMDRTAPMDVEVPPSMLKLRKRIRHMMVEQQVGAVFQPIVSPDGQSLFAHEILGRGAVEGLPTAPGPLLELAGSVGQAISLSRLMNTVGIETFEGSGRLFFNVHPDELDGLGFVNHLNGLRRRAESVDLVVEVPETAITRPGQLRELQASINDLGIELAFDDFGAGRSRLLELIDSPPQFIKFDRSVVQALAGEPSKRRLIRALVDVTRDLGVVTIAEGVESASDVESCGEVGFDYLQGYYYSPDMAN